MIKAFQVAPEYQQSPFGIECWQGIIFTGNRYYNSHIPDELQSIFNRFDEKHILRALQLHTGKKWAARTIRGSSQSEWQNIYYPLADYSKGVIDSLEIEYFNMGNEWKIELENDEFYMYSYSLDDLEIKKEIANEIGTTPENITLYKFDGYTKTPKYREV